MASYKIYKITNKVNGKVYIGRTTRTLEERWKAHRGSVNSRQKCYKFQRAIKEFGPENFEIEQIDCADELEEANEKEVYWIWFYNSMEDGYNTSPGGRAGGSRKKVMSVTNHSAIAHVVDKPHLRSAGQHWVSVKNLVL